MEYARVINDDPHAVTDGDVEKLREVGLGAEGIVQLTHLVSDFASYNRLDTAMDTDYDYQEVWREIDLAGLSPADDHVRQPDRTRRRSKRRGRRPVLSVRALGSAPESICASRYCCGRRLTALPFRRDSLRVTAARVRRVGRQVHRREHPDDALVVVDHGEMVDAVADHLGGGVADRTPGVDGDHAVRHVL